MMEYTVKYTVECTHCTHERDILMEEKTYKGTYTWKDIYTEVI